MPICAIRDDIVIHIECIKYVQNVILIFFAPQILAVIEEGIVICDRLLKFMNNFIR